MDVLSDIIKTIADFCRKFPVILFTVKTQKMPKEKFEDILSFFTLLSQKGIAI